MNEYILTIKEHSKLMFIKADCYDDAIEKVRVFENLSEYGISKIIKLHEYRLNDGVFIDISRLCTYYQKKYGLNHVLFASNNM